MIETNSMQESLSLEILIKYHNSDYSGASEKARLLLAHTKGSENRFLVSVDLAHLLCLAGKYDEAQPMLKTLVEKEESNRYPDSGTLEKLYLAYANCLFNHNDYIRFYHYINKYLKIAETSNPEAYSLVKQLLD